MKFIAAYLITPFRTLVRPLVIALVVLLSFHSAFAAPNITQKHSHNGRAHSHKLPASGVKHFHKHMHNGRAHIHPYSAKVGFKHSHTTKNSRAKAWKNAVKHQHAGRTHSHPLPRTGVDHDHRHKHGGRSHIHPLPVSGLKHFHELKKRNVSARPPIKADAKPVVNSIQKTRIINGLSIKQQMAAVLNTPLSSMPKRITNHKKPAAQIQPQGRINLNDKKYSDLLKRNNSPAKPLRPQPTLTNPRQAPIMNKHTINKVLAYGYHKHDGRAHQHALPATGVRHGHKHAHTGRVHSHVIPALQTKHSHRNNSDLEIAKTNKKIRSRKVKKRVIPVKPQTKTATVSKLKTNTKRVTLRKNTQRANPKPIKSIQRRAKQTPQQVASGNRQLNLALRYENGTGVKKNLSQAVNWYLRAAKQGNSKAQFNLASLYETGEGVARNIPQAIRWYTESAANGDINAQLNLGNQYARGINVPKNINEAAKWYMRAADQGDMRARANLNYLIEDYNGVIKK